MLCVRAHRTHLDPCGDGWNDSELKLYDNILISVIRLHCAALARLIWSCTRLMIVIASRFRLRLKDSTAPSRGQNFTLWMPTGAELEWTRSGGHVLLREMDIWAVSSRFESVLVCSQVSQTTTCIHELLRQSCSLKQKKLNTGGPYSGSPYTCP